MQHDSMRNIFPGQLHILNKSDNYYSSHLDRDSNFTMISDRSIFSCYSFIECYFREGYFSRFSNDYLINEWWDKCNQVHKPDCFIFLDFTPALCQKCLMDDSRHTFLNRNTWTEEFLTVLHSSHEKMFSEGEIPMERIVVTEDMTLTDVAMAVRKIIIESKFS